MPTRSTTMKNSATKNRFAIKSSTSHTMNPYVSTRKLDPKTTLGFAEKAPRFVVRGKSIVAYKR